MQIIHCFSGEDAYTRNWFWIERHVTILEMKNGAVGRMQELENARKEQEKLAGKKEETKVSKRMFRAG